MGVRIIGLHIPSFGHLSFGTHLENYHDRSLFKASDYPRKQTSLTVKLRSSVSLKEMALKFGVRPFQMLLTPICFFVALYASFVYGILYANLAAFPIAFEEERHWNLLVGALVRLPQPIFSLFKQIRGNKTVSRCSVLPRKG